MSDEVQTSQTSLDHLDSLQCHFFISLCSVKLQSVFREINICASLECQVVGLKDLSHNQGLKPPNP